MLGPWRFVATAQAQEFASQSLQSRWAVMAANAQPPQPPAAQPASQQTSAPALPSDPMEVLRAELFRRGMNPDALNLSYVERQVQYPGGSYVNRLIVCGGWEFSVDLMLKNPAVTALEIQRMGTGV